MHDNLRDANGAGEGSSGFTFRSIDLEPQKAAAEPFEEYVKALQTSLMVDVKPGALQDVRLTL